MEAALEVLAHQVSEATPTRQADSLEVAEAEAVLLHQAHQPLEQAASAVQAVEALAVAVLRGTSTARASRWS